MPVLFYFCYILLLRLLIWNACQDCLAVTANPLLCLLYCFTVVYFYLWLLQYFHTADVNMYYNLLKFLLVWLILRLIYTVCKLFTRRSLFDHVKLRRNQCRVSLTLIKIVVIFWFLFFHKFFHQFTIFNNIWILCLNIRSLCDFK